MGVLLEFVGEEVLVVVVEIVEWFRVVVQELASVLLIAQQLSRSIFL